MSTAALPMQNRPRREMVEVKAPQQFNFEKAGQTLGGVLIEIEAKEITDKATKETKIVPEYLFQDGERRYTCLAPADLQKKVQPGHIGHWLDIRYESDDSSFQKPGQSPMKVFKVLASKTKEPGFEHLGIAS